MDPRYIENQEVVSTIKREAATAERKPVFCHSESFNIENIVYAHIPFSIVYVSRDKGGKKRNKRR